MIYLYEGLQKIRPSYKIYCTIKRLKILTNAINLKKKLFLICKFLLFFVRYVRKFSKIVNIR